MIIAHPNDQREQDSPPLMVEDAVELREWLRERVWDTATDPQAAQAAKLTLRELDDLLAQRLADLVATGALCYCCPALAEVR